MSEEWAERQRHTNRLARRIGFYLFKNHELTARQIYGFSKLSWITNSFDGDNAAYIESTKIPALGDILGIDHTAISLDQVAMEYSEYYQDSSFLELIKMHSGFTNFYKAYRNSVFPWIEGNKDTLISMFKTAYNFKSEEDRLKIVNSISELPGIPMANHSTQLMKPENFVTPVLFMLDPDIIFPLINGNEGVQNLLKVMGVSGPDIVAQYKALVSLYGKGGIKDAADLDQVGRDLPEFLNTDKRKATKKLLENKNTTSDGELPLKDEADVEAIRKAGSIKQRRIHNKLTNKLKNTLTKFTLLEGGSNNCMYDVLVKEYDSNKNDLLIEVKSSGKSPHIRMAVGQAFNYWFILKGNKKPHLALLLPERPSIEIEKFLNWMNVGLIWFENDQLCTVNNWLEHISKKI